MKPVAPGTTVLVVREKDGSIPKCNKGNLHLAFGGPTGYWLECDNDACQHAFSVKVGER